MLGAVHEHATTVALLGPTNTGKTHRAVERMLEHASGMIGLPLRLLAREVYDRVTARVGEQAVALITGEEKRIPPRPRYFVCTVESMPLGREVDFLAVDEIQLATHPQRGHVFTDRLLYARGRRETWFLGADTMRPILEELVPTAAVQRHPRLSKLSAVGRVSLTSLPPRSAVIAFSAAEVYELADRLRRRRGGAAVVLGALSPRTRNAQVAMYQAGEVDYLVATDAVGMGLNMDVDHVAFAALTKFDGARKRALAADELAQIAGRAGRHVRDGTFGTLAPLELRPEVSFAIEAHRFAPLRRLFWRNSDLDTSSLAALVASLEKPSRRRVLVMVDEAADLAALRILAGRAEIAARTRHGDGVRLLWEVCRIPDFRKLLVEHHAALLQEIFLQLSGPRAQLDPDFMHQRVGRLEDDRGDIDTLMMRMDLLRTWNYVAHQPSWVHDAVSWQERTRRAEDVLSQALHDRLVERFVERGRRVRRRVGGPGGQRSRAAPARFEREVREGPFAQLLALRDAMRPESLPVTVDEWVEEVAAAPHQRFAVDAAARVQLLPSGGGEGSEVGQLIRGVDLLHPEVKLSHDQPVAAGGRARMLRRLRAWSRDLVEETLGPLRDPRLSELGPAARGLVYQLERGLGTVTTRTARPQLRELSRRDREVLSEVRVVLGRRFVFVESALTPEIVTRRAALACAFFGRAASIPAAGLAPRDERLSAEIYLAIGFAVLGGQLLRVDRAEALAERLAALAALGPFALPEGLLDAVPEDAASIVRALGFRETEGGFMRPARRRKRRRR